jgi:hypothetical protein
MSPVQRLRSACCAIAAGVLVAAASPAGSLGAGGAGQPLRFFEGRTEMISVVKVVMKKPYRSRTTGRGQILPDGSLMLVQQVQDAGKPAHMRHWKIRRTGARRFTGTMSEATGPVRVEQIRGKYRFKFRMKGSLAVEQWLTPAPGGRSAHSRVIVRKLGMRVASSEGTIRKL